MGRYTRRSPSVYDAKSHTWQMRCGHPEPTDNEWYALSTSVSRACDLFWQQTAWRREIWLREMRGGMRSRIDRETKDSTKAKNEVTKPLFPTHEQPKQTHN